MTRKARNTSTGYNVANNGKSGKRNKRKVVETRRDKQAITGKQERPEKFQEERKRNIKPLQALNSNQKKYIQSINDNVLTIGYGASGSGKTYVACYHAAVMLLNDEIEKIVLIRPYEAVGRSVGMRPGTNEEKLTPLMQSMIEPLREVLGDSMFEYCLSSGKIVLEALEDVRGRSYKNAVVIVDEIQSCDIQTVKTLTTRTGEGSKLILCGDGVGWQVDIRGKSGLVWFVDMITRLRQFDVDYLDEYDEWELHDNIGMVKFTSADNVRSGISKMLVKVYDEEEV